jgi:hypothetical protein
MVWWRCLSALRYQARGQLVVFEGYLYDVPLPPGGSLVRLIRPYLRILSRTCPRPGLVVRVDSDRPLEAVRADVMRLVWERYKGRIGR